MIDAHLHAWRYEPALYPWISDAMPGLKQDRLPAHVHPEQESLGVTGVILVQARMDEAETAWMLELAEADPRILGVVGWCDLTAPDADSRLARLAERPQLKGLRHMIQDEAEADFMLRPDFLRGLRAVERAGLSYDLLVRASQLPLARLALAQVPGLRVVLDHGGKPPIQAAQLEPWRSQLRRLAAELPDLHCKASGLVTEADWRAWQPAQLEPYLDTLLEAFGPQRLLFGSDWPVCTLAAGFPAVFELLDRFVARRCPQAREAVFGGNAAQFYRL